MSSCASMTELKDSVSKRTIQCQLALATSLLPLGANRHVNRRRGAVRPLAKRAAACQSQERLVGDGPVRLAMPDRDLNGHRSKVSTAMTRPVAD
jgi:hypothetical protein